MPGGVKTKGVYPDMLIPTQPMILAECFLFRWTFLFSGVALSTMFLGGTSQELPFLYGVGLHPKVHTHDVLTDIMHGMGICWMLEYLKFQST